jgi:5'/3'-nucleotidase SurE
MWWHFIMPPQIPSSQMFFPKRGVLAWRYKVFTYNKMKVLIINDDGPPSVHSPFLENFVDHITKTYDWQVEVVIPHAQNSWTGKALGIIDKVVPTYYNQITKAISLQKNTKDWVLLSGTPACCANIALTHLYQDIDLVISGPNFGRNAGTGSTISSGTLAAAIESSLLGKRAISLSFAYFGIETTRELEKVNLAVKTSCQIIQQLFENWNISIESPHVFNVNIPLCSEYKGLEWTVFQKGGYGSLYNKLEDGFIFSPEFSLDSEQIGTDYWAIANDKVSITPMFSHFHVEADDLTKFKGLVKLM